MNIPEKILWRIFAAVGSAGSAVMMACSPTVASPPSPISVSPPATTTTNSAVIKTDLDNKECPSMILRAENATPVPLPASSWDPCYGCGMG